MGRKLGTNGPVGGPGMFRNIMLFMILHNGRKWWKKKKVSLIDECIFRARKVLSNTKAKKKKKKPLQYFMEYVKLSCNTLRKT
jgi:hypothetical protein